MAIVYQYKYKNIYVNTYTIHIYIYTYIHIFASCILVIQKGCLHEMPQMMLCVFRPCVCHGCASLSVYILSMHIYIYIYMGGCVSQLSVDFTDENILASSWWNRTGYQTARARTHARNDFPVRLIPQPSLMLSLCINICIYCMYWECIYIYM